MLADPNDQLVKLTDGQRDCLRLVLAHNSSKEIARQLGVSPHTVDQRLRVATRTLGVGSRFEAARLLANAERDEGGTYQPLIYQRPYIAQSPTSEAFPPSSVPHGTDQAAPTGQELQSSQAGYAAYSSPTAGSLWPVPAKAGGENDLTTGVRIAWIIAIAVGSLFAFGSFVTGLEALSRLL